MCGVAVGVELRLDQTPRPTGEPNAQVGIFEQAFDGYGERGGISLRNHEPRHPVVYDLGDAGYGGRDAGGAQGHRLQKDGRQSVAVPVGTHDAAQRTPPRPERVTSQLVLGTGSRQIDSTFESQTCDLRSQLALLWSGTDDLAGKLSTLVGEMAQPSISTTNPFFSTSRPTPRIRGDRSRGDE